MEAETLAQVTIANLLAQGLVEQKENGLKLTLSGEEKARLIWERLSPEDKLLLIPYLRKALHLRRKDKPDT